MNPKPKGESIRTGKHVADYEFLKRLAKTYNFQDLKRLERAIVQARAIYLKTLSSSPSRNHPNTLRKLRTPLDSVIDLLEEPGNVAGVERALGAGGNGASRRAQLLDSLHRISRCLPSISKGQGPHPKDPALHAFVLSLARFWQIELGTKFSQVWVKGADGTNVWAAAGLEDTELGVFIEPEVGHGTTAAYSGVQA